MDKLENLATTLHSMPLEYLVVFLGFAAIGLAGFAIHVVYSIAKGRRP